MGFLAGTAFTFKTHLAPFALAIAAAWIVTSGRRDLVAATGGTLVGASLAALPELIGRWIDTENPLFPAYNNIFHSPYWPPRHETFNFPKLHDPGPLGPLSTFVKTFTETPSFEGGAPLGAFGFMAAAVGLFLLVGWVLRRRGGVAVGSWFAVLAGAASWYLQFRNARYVLPVGAVAVLALGLTIQRPRLSRGLEKGPPSPAWP